MPSKHNTTILIRNELQRINSNKVSNQRVHQNRTIIKQLYYLFDILIIGSNESMVMGMSIERLREIEQMIGDWHDQVNSIHYINAYRKTKDQNVAIRIMKCVCGRHSCVMRLTFLEFILFATLN